LFSKLGKDEGYEIFRQPGGRSPEAENVENLPDGYYRRLIAGKDQEWIRVYVDGEDAVSDEGAIWGAWIAALEARGGLCAFDHPVTDVFTNWDLGRSDSTAIWFWRLNANRVPEIIDHYENHGHGLSHYFDVVDSKGYTYTKHWLPHDAEAKTLATQQSVLEQCAAKYGWQKIAIVPQMSLIDGINAARWMLEQPIQIHERCDVPYRMEHSGVDALREYRFEWDEDSQSYSRNPVHNWASHTADALRYMAVVVRFSEQITRPPPPAVPVDWERRPTFRDAIKSYRPKGRPRPYVPPEVSK
jgi:phage terminase large subunit